MARTGQSDVSKVGEMLVLREQKGWGTVLNPEAILDSSPEFHKALCVKVKVDVPVPGDDEFATFAVQLNIKDSVMLKDPVRYGEAFIVRRERVALERASALNFNEPIAANVNLADPSKHILFRRHQLSCWEKIMGTLPTVYPQWKGISIPDGTIVGKGSWIGLGRGVKNFARMHFVARGKERFLLIPREHAADINNSLRNYLRAKNCPEQLLSCPTFLDHCGFYFNEDYLIQNFGAKAIDVEGGEVLLIQAGVYAQCESKSASLVVSSNFITHQWLDLDPLDGCQDIDQDITAEDILKITQSATNTREYAAVRKGLGRNGNGKANNWNPLTIEFDEIDPAFSSDSSDEDTESGLPDDVAMT